MRRTSGMIAILHHHHSIENWWIINFWNILLGNVNSALVKKARDIINCVTITCRNVEFIPLVDSMHFVRTITQMSTLLLNHLLELESTFFMRKSKKKAEDATKNLRDEIIAFIIQSCHFLESLYDPYFQWRAYMFNGNVFLLYFFRNIKIWNKTKKLIIVFLRTF